MNAKFTPVYEKDGNRFFFRYEEFVASTEKKARVLGEASVVPVFFTGAEFTGEVVDFDDIFHYQATIGGWYSGVISGPLFDDAERKAASDA